MNDMDIQKIAIALKGSDHDSFATFTSGLRNNWVFLIAIMGVAMWVFNNFSGQTATNLQQDAKIEALTANMGQLTATVSTLAAQVEGESKNQSQIQQDIALIKADINTIKERIK